MLAEADTFILIAQAVSMILTGHKLTILIVPCAYLSSSTKWSQGVTLYLRITRALENYTGCHFPSQTRVSLHASFPPGIWALGSYPGTRYFSLETAGDGDFSSSWPMFPRAVFCTQSPGNCLSKHIIICNFDAVPV